ncbi:hypothetical protein GGX14DRAFT_369457 [Mycena pura]|uniref:Nephrocystin 3-like N-terminal domain-containing protein n=1 Tax=Mycena pura TaxID=153505 RepID=A0AAD6VCZ8_9AGAR|nr:hypothetical protein GGX14DRAFT_369457 [Mycena pura]
MLNIGKGFQILCRAAACDAFHNSAERYPQPRCHSETRIEMLDDLWNWTSEEWLPRKFSHRATGSNSILWLHGPAGAGKSAVAQSLCQKLSETEGRAFASFFFKRQHTSRGNGNKMFPTISYQLAVLHPGLKRAISQNVENDPSIVDKSLSIQLLKLIIEPCRQIQSLDSVPMTIIIDGLDECDGQHIQEEILRSVGNSMDDPHLRLRFLIVSRPEPHIAEMFTGPCLDSLHCSLNIEEAFEDVRKYLLDEFTRVHREHHQTMGSVPMPWPSAAIVDQLVRKSSGYFIYASTVIKFIDDKDFRPTDRLDIIMRPAEANVESPFEALDQLYTQILSNVPARPQLLQILSAIVEFEICVCHIKSLLQLKPGDLRLMLRGLRSVVEVPEEDIYEELIWHHASFLDFLKDPARSGIFYPSTFQTHTEVIGYILKALSYNYDDPSLNQNNPLVL